MNKRKLTTALLSAVMIGSTMSALSANAAFDSSKDPNGDGYLDFADAVYISQYLVGHHEPADLSELDVDCNDVVSVVDQIYVQMYEAGSITGNVGNAMSPDSVTSTISRSYNVYSKSTHAFLRSYTLNVNQSSNSNGTAGTMNVIGTDNRIIDWNNSGTVKIQIGLSGWGTGFVVNEHTIATAAHVVYDTAGNYVPDILSVKVFDSNHNPVTVTPVEVHVPTDYVNATEHDRQFDYALITIEDDLSDYMSYNFGAVTNDAATDHIALATVGFPGYVNGVHVNNASSDHMQYISTGSVTSLDSKNIFYNADTSGGNSGGPIYAVEYLNGHEYHTVVGIHSGGYDLSNNAGVRIDSSILKFLVANPNLIY